MAQTTNDEVTTDEAAKPKRRWRTWQMVAVGFVSLILGAAIGASDTSGDRVASLEQELATARQRAANAEAADRDALQREFERGKQAAEHDLAAREAALAQQAEQLAKEKAEFDAAVAARRATQFGDGVHEVGVDIQPGVYKAQAITRCYWEKTARDGDIIDNDNVEGPVTVVIEASVFTFKSSRCGTWTKTG